MEAGAAVREIGEKIQEIDHVGDVDFLGMLLMFCQSNLKEADEICEKGRKGDSRRPVS